MIIPPKPNERHIENQIIVGTTIVEEASSDKANRYKKIIERTQHPAISTDLGLLSR
jgi:hypothetical protein